MLAGNALRHQMILPEQQALYDYWRAKCKGDKLPSRDDICPSDLIDYLPTVSMFEICTAQEDPRFKFRLAGTKFYDIYKTELTGQYVCDMPQGSRRAYWNRVLSRVTDRRRPSAGVVRSALSGRTHMAQFWIRMPLVCENNQVKVILGFDKFVKLSELETEVTVSDKIYA